MIRAAKTIFVFSIGLLGCNRDPMISRSAPAGQPPAGGGAQSGGDAALAADGSRWDAGPSSGDRDSGAPADTGPQAVPGDAAMTPSPGRDAGTVLPGSPDAPVSRPSDAGVTGGLADAPILRPSDAGVTGGFADAPVTRRQDAAGTPADGGTLPPPSDAAASRIDALSSGSDAAPLPGTVLPGGACTDSGQCASLPGLTAVCVPPSI